MKCIICKKELDKNQKDYCSSKCYKLLYMRRRAIKEHNKCKCGNIKMSESKRCYDCYCSKHRGQLSRLPSMTNKFTPIK